MSAKDNGISPNKEEETRNEEEEGDGIDTDKSIYLATEDNKDKK